MRKPQRYLWLGLASPPLFGLALVSLLYVLTFFNGNVGVEQNPLKTSLAGSALAWNESRTLRVVTFNIQDLMIVADHHEDRMRRIARTLAEFDPDIAGFQESFIEEHRVLLREELIAHTSLVHFAYFPSGRGGSGLYVASRYPIAEVYFHRFRDNNPWFRIWEGDFWAGKGVALARIKVGEGQFLDFFNTHTQADYEGAPYRDIRQSQLSGLASFVDQARLDEIPALLVGDMNCTPDDPEFASVVEEAKLTRLMDVPSELDHIFGIGRKGYAYRTRRTLEIGDTGTEEKPSTPLSDHNGYLSEIVISPARD